jgi:hypothetical protein
MNNSANNRNGQTVSLDGAVLVFGLASTAAVPATAQQMKGASIDSGKAGVDGAIYVRYI